jgi:ketosteroid isomerase-like protein
VPLVRFRATDAAAFITGHVVLQDGGRGLRFIDERRAVPPSTPPEPDLSSIEQRLAMLEDEREILRTLHAYGNSLDYGNEDEWIDCWLEDAVLYWPNPPYESSPFAGREPLCEAFHGHTHAPAVYHKHFVLDSRIDIDGDTARVESYYARLDTGEDGPYIRAFGRYLDVLQRCGDKRWRFKERRAEPEGMSSRPRPGGRVGTEAREPEDGR